MMLQDQQARTAQYAANAAQAENEGADYQAAANQDAANKTNALAQTLAQARNSTPGGGIRMGIQNGSQSANAAAGGLASANAAGRAARKKKLLDTQTDAQFAAQNAQKTTDLFAQQRANSMGAGGNGGLQLIPLW